MPPRVSEDDRSGIGVVAVASVCNFWEHANGRHAVLPDDPMKPDRASARGAPRSIEGRLGK
jgi:hypothetical protein